MQRHHRLPGSADIGQLRRHGQRWHHPLAILFIQPNHQDVSRFGFSASRRAGNAVARNRAKRLLREAVRLHQVQPGWDCLIVARTATAVASFAEVEQAILDLFQRSHILRSQG